ncbi:MAG: NAD(P)/FAD-dependent oxidoreductase [Pseudomonadota bacterium]
MDHIETEYLIVGAGAVGMAFADTLLSETKADIVIVDRYGAPGGHWTVAYPFVRLHQPASFYGVNSRELSSGRIDEIGLNQGLGDLSSGSDILAYYDAVMRDRFLASGRVRYLPMTDWLGDGLARNRLTNTETTLAAKRVVDTTWLRTSVPATHTPDFTVEPGVRMIPVNDLPAVDTAPDGFTVVGGGKTGIDACLWLLQMGVSADRIRWIVSRDAWFLDRGTSQTDPGFFRETMGTIAAQLEAIAGAETIDDMFDRLEACGYFLRLDPSERPNMFHGATITRRELDALRTIKNVVRLGRVKHIGAIEMTLHRGVIPTTRDTVHVDCSASAVTNFEMKPVFEGSVITPQTVRSYQPAFSAALVAWVEANRSAEVEKNRLCQVVPLPNHDTDFIRFTAAFMLNQYNWSQEADLKMWLKESRLDGFSSLASGIPKDDVAKQDIMARIRDASLPAVARLRQFEAQIDNISGS